MKIRYIAAVALCTAGITAGVVTQSAPAHASGTTLQTVTQTEHIVSAKCYVTDRRTVTYYKYSAKTGWTLYPSPKVTTLHSETCRK